MQSQEPFRLTVTQEALDRNPIRFGQLMDISGAFPFGKSPARPRQPRSERKIPPYLSLFDEEPANGALHLRSKVDFDKYDRELSNAIYDGLKGKKIPFPDVYRTKR